MQYANLSRCIMQDRWAPIADNIMSCSQVGVLIYERCTMQKLTNDFAYATLRAEGSS